MLELICSGDTKRCIEGGKVEIDKMVNLTQNTQNTHIDQSRVKVIKVSAKF